MDIRKQTAIIIRREGKYLAGRNLVTGDLIWRESYSDAWRTRQKALAEMVASKVGGELMLFNPIVCQVRRFSDG